jgi:N-acetylglucosaminyl-diphospho-decaprenol L-rhamnosyltransferase
VSSSPSITVIVVAYQGERWIPACLETLRCASSERLRLCLVDNSGNGDVIPRELAGVEMTVLQTPSPLGFAEANNFALREVGLNTEYVCFLNQDTRSGAGWLDACAATLAQSPELGAVSPFLKTYDDAEWDPGFRECAQSSPAFLRDASTGRPLDRLYIVPRVTAAAMFIRSRVLQQVGPFDPIFGSYYEDYDLCRRIRGAGYQIGISAQGTVSHYSGSSTTSEPARRKRMRQIIRNRTILRIREAGDHRIREIVRYIACTMPYNFGRSLFRTASSQPFLVQLRAHWELLGEWRRLVSERYDHRIWTEYLHGLGWPT